MRQSSRQVVFVNTSPPEDRVFLLKPMHILQNMKDDAEDVEASSLIHKYQNRPTQLENITLAHFASWYRCVNTKPTPRRPLNKRNPEEFLPESPEQEEHEDDTPDDSDILSSASLPNIAFKKRKVIFSNL